MTGWPTPPPTPQPAPSGGAASPQALVAGSPQPDPVQSDPVQSDPTPEQPVITRRLRRMVPRPAEEAPAPTVTRDVLNASRSSVKPQTRRDRKLVGTLPDWDPLPPGELVVSKPRSTP